MTKRLRRKPGLRNLSYSLFDEIENQIAPRVLLVDFFYWPFLSIIDENANPLAAVGSKGMISHVSPEAARLGIKVGDKVRSSLSIVPDLVVIPTEAIDRDGSFAKLANVLERFSPLVEIVDAGVCATNAKGPARYFGGELSLASQVKQAMFLEASKIFFAGNPLPDIEGGSFRSDSIFSFGVSIADGVFAARLGARESNLVEVGGSAEFLRQFSIFELPDVEVANTLSRLGVNSLGEFADLDFNLVTQRFGMSGAILHRMASGLDTSSLQPREIKEDFTVKIELPEQLEVASAVIFACKQKVEELLSSLLGKGYLCQVMRVLLVSENGDESIRNWAMEDGFSTQSLLERIRWQIEAWSSDPVLAPRSGVIMVELAPERVISSHRIQLGLDGGEKVSMVKVSQALSRVDSMVSRKASFPTIKGSRTPKGGIEMVPWQQYLFDLETKDRVISSNDPPWPGKLLGGSPAVCFDREIEVLILTQEGDGVVVTAGALLDGDPYLMKFCDLGRTAMIEQWSTPWPLMERWWDPRSVVRVARMQVIVHGIGALLIKNQDGKWFVEGLYD